MVNNIGSGSGSNDPLPKQKDWKSLLDVNFFAQHVTSLFIKSLLNTNGNIIFIGSIVIQGSLKRTNAIYSSEVCVTWLAFQNHWRLNMGQNQMLIFHQATSFFLTVLGIKS